MWINPRYQWPKKESYLGPDSDIKIVPSPVGGWDAISPLAVMEPKYASVLINWVPRTGWVELRGGYNAWVQAIAAAPVETLMVYRPPSGTETMFAAAGTEIWNVSSNGIPTLARSGLINARWQYVNFMPASGNPNLCMVNGADQYTLFNGTTWSNPVVTGISTTLFININAHKRRLWFIPASSTSAWYLPTDAIAGAATELPLGSFMTKGGYLMAMATWTIDGGNGPDDLAVFISSKGQAIVYKGTDPNNANAWALVGVFDIAPPISRRCFAKLGSDVALITTEGLLPLSQALPFDPSGVRSVAFTNRIQNAMLDAAKMSRELFGWQVLSFSQQGLVILNVPQSENTQQVQYVMNSVTGAWCQFNGWNANCFEIFNESLYFGDNDGNVNLAYAGGLDLVTPILADMKCAFNYFEAPGRVKNATMVRPFLIADGTLVPTIGIDVDFGDASLAAPVIVLTPQGALWDVSKWDQSSWSQGSAPVINWLSCTGLGTALAIRMKVNLGAGGSAGSAAQQSVFDTGVFDTAVFDGNGATLRSGQGVPTLRVNVFEINLEMGGPI